MRRAARWGYRAARNPPPATASVKPSDAGLSQPDAGLLADARLVHATTAAGSALAGARQAGCAPGQARAAGAGSLPCSESPHGRADRGGAAAAPAGAPSDPAVGTSAVFQTAVAPEETPKRRRRPKGYRTWPPRPRIQAFRPSAAGAAPRRGRRGRVGVQGRAVARARVALGRMHGSTRVRPAQIGGALCVNATSR